MQSEKFFLNERILYHPQKVDDPNKKSDPVLNDEPSAPLLYIPETKFGEKGKMKCFEGK